MTGKVKLRGDKDLKKLLNKLPNRVHNKVSRAGITEAAKVYRKGMKARAPMDTGDLKKNLRYRIRRLRKGVYVGRAGPTTDAFYARFLEYGSSPHVISSYRTKSGGVRDDSIRKKGMTINGKVRKTVNHPGQTKKPFLRNAFEAETKTAIADSKKMLWKRLLQEVKR